MPSDEKRREVAENLRYLTIGHSINYKEQFFDELAEVVVGFEDHHDFNVVLEKLADLIEPGPERTCHLVIEDETGVCSNCGEDIDGYGWSYCHEKLSSYLACPSGFHGATKLGNRG